MKYSLSRIAILLILVFSICLRLIYFENNTKNGYNATSWDALGYYMYLPATFIHQDVKELKWFPEADSTYHMSGGWFYQAIQLENGNYTFKYLSGVAIMESPFFFAGHGLAKISGAAQDGFSWPYQYSIMFAAIFWFFIGLVFLRKVLLHYFDELTTSLTLLLLTLASNLMQYVSIDGAMSHAFIFPLYAMVIWFTIRWYEKPKLSHAFLIGLVSGIAVISRPTELIIIFIPLLWIFKPTAEKNSKWKFILQHKKHLFLTVFGGILGILPQLLYWKYSTGSFIYDVGSKWFFFNPWFRVLFGHEIGWFVYTPIAIFMIWGLWFMKGKNFRTSVITFCILNIWIIIAWSDWKYGATYSTRALTQSYPVFALPLACFISAMLLVPWKKYLVFGLGMLLIGLNIYQLSIYNKGILHDFSPFIWW